MHALYERYTVYNTRVCIGAWLIWHIHYVYGCIYYIRSLCITEGCIDARLIWDLHLCIWMPMLYTRYAVINKGLVYALYERYIMWNRLLVYSLDERLSKVWMLKCRPKAWAAGEDCSNMSSLMLWLLTYMLAKLVGTSYQQKLPILTIDKCPTHYMYCTSQL